MQHNSGSAKEEASAKARWDKDGENGLEKVENLTRKRIC